MNLNEVRLYFEVYYGRELNFFNFYNFVKNEIAPHMEMEFVIEDYFSELFDEFTKYQYTAEQIHRGAGKTEFDIMLTIYYAVCQPINPFSNKRIVEQAIITQAGDVVNVLGNRIKHYFYENPKLRLFIPDGAMKKDDRKNEQWNNKEMYLKNGSIIHMRPINSKAIRSLHVDRVLGDDLVGENSQLVDKDIEEKWFAAVHGITTAKNALVDVTGTPKRLSDVMYRMKESPGYFFKARPILNDDGTILSKKRWTKEKIDQVRRTIGSVKFQSEYMLNPIDDQTSIIKSDWINQCKNDKMSLINSEEIIKQYKLGKYSGTHLEDNKLNLRPAWAKAVYLGMDFAFSDRITADKSALVIVAEYERGEKTFYIVLDIITKQGWSGQQQLNLLKELNNYYKFDMVGLEENSIKAIVDKIKDLQMPIKRFWTGSSDEKEQTREKYKPYKTVSKVNLIERLSIMLENKEIIFPAKDEYSKKIFEQTFSELITFAREEGKLVEIGVHSDIGIGLAYALRVSSAWNVGFLV